jgi:predicted nucleotidyltransferase
MRLPASDLEQIRKYFAQRPVIRAYLFGSYVRDQADEQSDIDIVVELDYHQRIGLLFVQMQMDLEAMLDAKVDLVSANALSKYLKPIVDREKKLIYER